MGNFGAMVFFFVFFFFVLLKSSISVHFIHRFMNSAQICQFRRGVFGHSNAILCWRMPRLSIAERGRALGMLEAGMGLREVARLFQCNFRTISRLQRRYAETGRLEDRARPGRPRVTTDRQDHYVRITHLRDRFYPASRSAAVTIGTHGRPVCPNTIRNRLREGRMFCRRPFMGPILTQRHRAHRLRWATQRRRWTFRQWGDVLFTDESRFCLSVPDGRRRVWRRRGERHARCCVREFDRWGGGSVMVWGGITRTHRTALIVVQGNLHAQRYIDHILQPVAIPFLNEHNVRVFQHDNARPHVARITREFMDDQEVMVMEWPAYSPDLNPIEHLWDVLGRRVMERAPTNVHQLSRMLLEEWEAIPQDEIRRLIDSMRRRCAACIRADGGHIPY